MSGILIHQDFGDDHAAAVIFEIEFTDEAHIGREARLDIVSSVEVKDSDPENDATTIHSEKFQITAKNFRTSVPRSTIPDYAYRGRKIDLLHSVKVVVDDAIFFDSNVDAELDMPSLPRQSAALAADAETAMEPTDVYSLVRNLAVLSIKQKLAMLGAFITGILGAAGNFILYLYDSFFASIPLFYTSSDGAFWGTGAGAFAGIAGFFMVYKRILRSYMSASLKKNAPPIKPGRDYRLADFVAAKSNVDLQNLTMQVVVANLENGQYWRGSGTDRRRVSFAVPTRAVLVFDKTVSSVPKGAPVESYFSDRISFDDVFTHLYPQLTTSSTHGLTLSVEIRIMSEDYADTELHLGSRLFDRTDFLSTSATDNVS